MRLDAIQGLAHFFRRNVVDAIFSSDYGKAGNGNHVKILVANIGRDKFQMPDFFGASKLLSNSTTIQELKQLAGKFNIKFEGNTSSSFLGGKLKPQVKQVIELLALSDNLQKKNVKLIVPVHYSGISCDMELLYELAQKYNIGEERNMTPVIRDPKDLIAALRDLP